MALPPSKEAAPFYISITVKSQFIELFDCRTKGFSWRRSCHRR